MTRLLLAGPLPQTTSNLDRAIAAQGLVALRCGLDEVVPSIRIDAVDAVLVNPLAGGGAGFGAVRAIRRAMLDVGITLLVDAEPSIEDIVLWLGYADDCLIGFLDPREVVAHIRAVERRRFRHLTSRVSVGPVTVDTQARVAEVAGREIPLTGTEFDLFEVLVTRAGRCLTKNMLLDHLYGGENEPDQKIIDVMVCKIRQKLKRVGGPGDFVETIWGRGYCVRRAAQEAGRAAA